MGEPPDAIVLYVSLAHGVRIADIRGRSRLAHIVRARHECWWRLRRQGWSLPAIGREFGVDHTTVLAALRKFKVRVFVEGVTA